MASKIDQSKTIPVKEEKLYPSPYPGYVQSDKYWNLCHKVNCDICFKDSCTCYAESEKVPKEQFRMPVVITVAQEATFFYRRMQPHTTKSQKEAEPIKKNLEGKQSMKLLKGLRKKFFQ